MHRPVAKSVLVCDDVLPPTKDGKITVLNIWNRIQFEATKRPPYRLGKLCVFACFRDGDGDVSCHVEIVNAETAEVVYRTKPCRLRFSKRHSTVYALFRIMDAPFPSQGVYLVELYCDENFVDDQWISVTAEEAAT